MTESFFSFGYLVLVDKSSFVKPCDQFLAYVYELMQSRKNFRKRWNWKIAWNFLEFLFDETIFYACTMFYALR